MNHCRHCRFSEGDLVGLWCWLHAKQATEACDRFEREPGADDEMIEMIYTADGVMQRYTFPDEKLDELLKRADAKFCDPAARADEPQRYARALQTQRDGGMRK